MATEYALITCLGRDGRSITRSGNTLSTAAAHYLRANLPVRFTGTPPGGLSTGVTYYVISTGLTSTAFQVSTSIGGAAVTLSSAGTSPKVIGAYWATLGATPRARYGSAGSERVFDSYNAMLGWYGDPTKRDASKDIVVEFEGAWDDASSSYNSGYSIRGYLSVTMTARIDGTYGSAFSLGSIITGYRRCNADQYDPSFGVNTGSGTAQPGFSVDGLYADQTYSGAGKQGAGILLTEGGRAVNCIARCVPGGSPAGFGGSAIAEVYSANRVENCIAFGSNRGFDLPAYYGMGSLYKNNTAYGNTTGFYTAGSAGASSANGSQGVNNVSVGNTTNWGTNVPLGYWSNNLGESGNSVWTVGTGATGLTTGTAANCFTNTGSSDFSIPAASPRIDAGASFSGSYTTEAYDITGAIERPAYNNGGAEAQDLGAHEYDLGYGPHPAVREITVTTGSVSGMQIVICDTDTQTERFRNNASGTSETYDAGTDGVVVDVTVMKAGYIPQRFTGIALDGASYTLDATPTLDHNYIASSGLTWGSNFTADTSNKYWKANAATSLRNLYSAFIEAWIAQSALVNKAFPFEMNGPGGMISKEGWESRGYSTAGTGISNTTLGYLTDDGLAYQDTSGTSTAIWPAISTKGVPTGEQSRYQQAVGSGTTNGENTGDINQLVQVYGDALHGNFDKRSTFVMKCQADGYDEAVFDLVDTFGNMEAQGYIVPLAPSVITGLATGDPGVTGVTITDHGASPVTWNGSAYSITITDSAANSGENILRWLRYHVEAGGTFQGTDAFNWHDLARSYGSKYQTVRGKVYGSAGASLKGVRVLRGSDAHPDFDLFTADDGSTYVPAVSISVANSNLADGSKVLLINETQANAELDIGTVSGGGGYGFTSLFGPGQAIEDGDILTLYATWASGSSYKKPYTESAVASASGITFLGTQETWSDANALSVDGSAQTEYSADYPNLQVDINSPDYKFRPKEAVAWLLYNMTTDDGIRNYFDCVRSSGPQYWYIQTAVVDMFLDNIQAYTITQDTATDVTVLMRDDSVYPQVKPTSGGGGIGMIQSGLVFVTTVSGASVITGSTADLPTAAEIAAEMQISAAASPLPVDVKKMNSATVTGTGQAGDLWRGA